jgi:hypothetical protein
MRGEASAEFLRGCEGGTGTQRECEREREVAGGGAGMKREAS